ncbi:MAG: DUF4070 domain-containing protein [Spirochaetales bacterium]|nr:DUF4070 domain-containing protein [Spirochaetales bacterium]
MKILLIYPEFPTTFWSFKHALGFISKKASEPPLGLLTIAPMLPPLWEKKLIDLNVNHLRNKDIQWADMVFVGGMSIQKKSFKSIVKRCNELGVKVVAGGPMVTENHEEFKGIDHFILNEAELTLAPFLEDLEKGCPEKLYSTSEFAELKETPLPDWSLLKPSHYASMDLQYSRGCPFNCEFCSITTLFGHKPRVKETPQFIEELDSLRSGGWHGPVFIVDDNFIGNKKEIKATMLPALISWQKKHKYPFTFTTEVSINLADDDELMELMSQAGFTSCFVGIESPEEESLAECGKVQNRNRDMLKSVKKMQRMGFTISGGFIVGFDNDPQDIFEKQARFIRKSGIATAMVGLLNAPHGTPLFRRLQSENRILESFSGNNTDGSLNFIPRMNTEKLLEGYKNLIRTIYSPREYFERIKVFLSEYHIPDVPVGKHPFYGLRALMKVTLRIGLFQRRGKRYFWKLLAYTIWNHPQKIRMALTMAVYGFHFRKIAEAI